LSETWILKKRLRLWFISLCNLLVTLFKTNILYLHLVFFYRWGSLPSWILLLCFKGKDLISFMNLASTQKLCLAFIIYIYNSNIMLKNRFCRYMWR
jgi:hypothetical protein